VSENDRPSLSILILGTSKNDKVTITENEEPMEAWEYTFSPEILELIMLFCGRIVVMKLKKSNPSRLGEYRM
jgi:hypothetical protein